MGAFNVELYRLGYIGHTVSNSDNEQPTVNTKNKLIETLHLVKMECPGSCGKRCPNHWCNAHNGQPYEKWIK